MPYNELRKAIEEELERIRDRDSHTKCLEQDRNALLNYYSQFATDHLDKLEPEERNRVYKMLDFTVLAHANDNLEVRWALGEGPCRDNVTLLLSSFRFTTGTMYAFRFRALLPKGDVRIDQMASSETDPSSLEES